MAQNFNPIYTLVPNVGKVQIPTANAQVKSDGTSAGTSADVVYKVFTTGANGSYVDTIRFFTVATTAATNSVATTLRAYYSSIAAPGATIGGTDTFLLGEVSVPLISSSHSTNATNYYEIVVNKAFPTGFYIHVSQHVAQTSAQFWQAICFGGDY